MTEILTLKQAAEYLQFNKDVLRRNTGKGKIPGRKVGGQWRYSKDALDKFIEHGTLEMHTQAKDTEQEAKKWQHSTKGQTRNSGKLSTPRQTESEYKKALGL